MFSPYDGAGELERETAKGFFLGAGVESVDMVAALNEFAVGAGAGGGGGGSGGGVMAGMDGIEGMGMHMIRLLRFYDRPPVSVVG